VITPAADAFSCFLIMLKITNDHAALLPHKGDPYPAAVVPARMLVLFLLFDTQLASAELHKARGGHCAEELLQIIATVIVRDGML